MKKLIIAILALLLSVYAALWLREEGGFVVVTLGDWTLQTSVLLFILGLVLAIAAVLLVVGLIRRIVGVPARVRGWRRRRGRRLAHRDLIEGLVRLTEGRDQDARKKLLRHSDRSDLPVLHLLGAAVVAQRQDDIEERDRLLAEALEVNPRARLAVGLVQAELQVASRQWERALATLNYLHELAPHAPRLLKLLLDTVLALKDDERLVRLLPELERHKVVPEAQLRELERDLAIRRFGNAHSLVELERLWGSLPKSQREDAPLIAEYVSALVRVHAADEAEALLRTHLQRHWDPMLVRRYGELASQVPDKQLTQLEKWLQSRPDDPALLYAAGRQALRAHIWGRARDYLEAAAVRGAGMESYFSLAVLLEKMQHHDRAREYYRRALEEVAPLDPLPPLTDAEQAGLAEHGAERSGRLEA